LTIRVPQIGKSAGRQACKSFESNGNSFEWNLDCFERDFDCFESGYYSGCHCENSISRDGDMPDNKNPPVIARRPQADEAISIGPRRLLRALRALAMTASFWVGALFAPKQSPFRDGEIASPPEPALSGTKGRLAMTASNSICPCRVYVPE
jgi:hypothetical protein